jgi:thymidylate synthase
MLRTCDGLLIKINIMKNKIDKQYTDLLQDILDNGVEKKDRTGTGTISVFGRQIRHDMKDGFPLLTTKKMPFKTIVTELLWFLRGETNIKPLVDANCHIWDGDTYKNFVATVEKNRPAGYTREVMTQDEFITNIKIDPDFAKEWGELGPIYGKQWRGWKKWGGKEVMQDFYESHIDNIDQIQNLINDLKTNPDSRRLMVNAWNVGELDQMVLPPCHYGFQVYTRELSLRERVDIFNSKMKKEGIRTQIATVSVSEEYWRKSLEQTKHNIPIRAISLMWNQRSVDTFLGLPFNIASYGLLLEIIAKEVNMVPDELIGNLGDTHLYLDHIEQAKEQIGRDLSDEERYNIWFNNNYETGMERHFDPNNLPDYENPYYEPTPKRTREPFELPALEYDWFVENWTTEEAKKARSDSFDAYIRNLRITDFIISGYKSHPAIKAPLSN